MTVPAILDWLNTYLFETIWCAVRRAWCWIVDKLEEAGMFVVDQVAAAFPELPDHADSINAVGDYLGLVNAWLPLTEAAAIVSLLVAWTITRTVVRWFLKVVPFLGG